MKTHLDNQKINESSTDSDISQESKNKKDKLLNSNIEPCGNNIDECITNETSEQSDENMVDLNNKYQSLSVNIQSIRPLRVRREELDYNVDNLKRLLKRLSQHLKTKYIMAFEVKKIINYFVSIEKKTSRKKSKWRRFFLYIT